MILRSPRLAIVGFDRDRLDHAVSGLVGYMSAWDIRSNVHVNDTVRELAGRPWERVTDASVSVGGDLTLLVLTATSAGELAPEDVEIVLATQTPVLLSSGVDDLAADAALPLEIAGYLVVDPAARSVRYEPTNREARGSLVDDLAGALPDRHGPEDFVGAGAMLALANRAPNLRVPDDATTTSDEVKAATESALPPLHPGNGQAAGRSIMISGTHSSAGKTFLVTAFARYFARRGLRVAPFKGQNMSNNARVVDGGEIGVAQYIQALAARTVPDVRMNPVLIKPQENRSHVMVLGRYDDQLSELPWRLRKPPSWPAVRRALHELRDEYDVIVMEGAGSPAEQFQYHNDIVNMRVAREFGTPTFLATDGARGGGIAHCYGTWQLLPPNDRTLLKGFIINRFFANGNPAMLRPGFVQLEELTGVPGMGIIPELPYTLPEEDSYSLNHRRSGAAGTKVAVVLYPHMSNIDEFRPVGVSGTAELVWANTPDDVTDADLLVLPGSKDVPASTSWLRQTGMAAAIQRHVNSGKRLLAICGGLQIVGKSFTDAAQVEGTGQGIGLLELRTTYEADKIQRQADFTFGEVDGSWQALSGLTVDGYEIRHGRTETSTEQEVVPDGVGFVRQNVLAIYFHGLLENANALEAILGSRLNPRQDLESTFDALAASLVRYLDMSRIEEAVLG